jgi:hypothetical protein
MKVVGYQPYAPAAFTPRINQVLIFRGWNCQMPRKKTPATPGIGPGTFRLVAQFLNHYATPGKRVLGSKIVCGNPLIFQIEFMEKLRED